MNSKINFSIIIPVYNAEKFVAASIDSALSQTYPAYEIILVDDGSTDKSGKICDRYAQKNESVKALHIENAGPFGARRAGIETISGDYCVFIDSDDALKPFALKAIAQYITEYDADCIIYQTDRIERSAEIQPVEPPYNGPIRVIENRRELYRTVFFDASYNSLCRKAVKSSLLQKKDYADLSKIRFGDDLLESLAVYQNRKRCLITEESLYCYYINPNSLTLNVLYKNIDTDNSLRNYVLHFLRDENVWNETDFQEYEQYCLHLYASGIKSALRTEKSFSENKNLLRSMKNSAYYNDFIKNIQEKSSNRFDELILWAFRHNLYGLIHIGLKAANLLRK